MGGSAILFPNRKEASRLVRNPDFIYKQVHNPDVTNPDLAVSGLRTCL